MGRTIIKEFDGTSDAQAILLALEDYHHPRFTRNKVEDKVESYFTTSYPISKSSLQDCDTRNIEDKAEHYSTKSYDCDESSTQESVCTMIVIMPMMHRRIVNGWDLTDGKCS